MLAWLPKVAGTAESAQSWLAGLRDPVVLARNVIAPGTGKRTQTLGWLSFTARVPVLQGNLSSVYLLVFGGRNVSPLGG